MWVDGTRVNMSELEIPEASALNIQNDICGILITGMYMRDFAL